MNQTQEAVRAFHEKFGLTIGARPGIVDAELRASLILEEALETVAAILLEPGAAVIDTLLDLEVMIGRQMTALANKLETPDDDVEHLANVVDGLCDLRYVADGAGVTFGVDLEPHFAEVHRSNMAKEGGAKRADGKMLKPEGWLPPDLVSILLDQIDAAEAMSASAEALARKPDDELYRLLRKARDCEDEFTEKCVAAEILRRQRAATQEVQQ